MAHWIAIAAGGSAGALCRFWVANGIYQWLGRDFPHGTLFVNVSGAFLMGLLTELLSERFAVSAEYRAALLVGFLGAYTTFSTFAIETLYLLEAASFLKALLNVFLSVALCLSAVWVGLIVGRQLDFGEAFPAAFRTRSVGGTVALGMLASLLAGVFVEFALPRLGWSASCRASVLVLALAAAIALSSLRLAPEAAGGGAAPEGLLGLFALNAVSGIAAMWLGLCLGRQL